MLLGLSTAACSPGKDPAWDSLARGFRPAPLLGTVEAWARAGTGGLAVDARSHEELPEAWLELTLAADDWTPEEPGRFSAARPWEGGFQHVPPGPMRLVTPEASYERILPTDEPRPGTYCVTPDRILLALDEGAEPPAETTFGVRVSDGREIDGAWRVVTRNHGGPGIPVWSGSAEEVRRDLPAESRLSFVTFLSRPDAPTDATEATFRIHLDGELVFQHEQGEGAAAHFLSLPVAGASDATMTFEVDGGPGLGVFYDPVVCPVEVGDYGQRPWKGNRPNVILFLADTFRADNLEIHGGAADLTPSLNRLADESIRCLRARAPSAWTLPSLGTLFTSTFPGQHGATDLGLALPRGMETLTEKLARNGYRTGAITDAGFFTISFGLDQGFDWFVQHDPEDWDLTRTIDKALDFVRRDDGRPLFLVVHTYRTHAPYRSGPDEDQSEWDRLVKRATEELDAMQPPPTVAVKKQKMLSLAEPWRAIYHDAVRDLDAEFGRLFGELQRNGVLDGGHLVFTSDHGEAFGENGDIHHGGRLWDVKLRVPLLLHGPGLEPRDLEWPASLIDVLPTIAELAGLPAEDDWLGTSLLALERERPQFAFRLENVRELAILDGTRKVLAQPDAALLRRGELEGAYDLALDPGEENDLAGGELTWPGELCRRVAPSVEVLLTPLVGPAAFDVDPEVQQNLSAIGYGGEGDDD